MGKSNDWFVLFWRWVCLIGILGPFISRLMKTPLNHLEVDPSRIEEGENLAANRASLEKVLRF